MTNKNNDLGDAVNKLKDDLKDLKKILKKDKSKRVTISFSTNPAKQVDDVDGDTEFATGIIEIVPEPDE